MKRSLHLTPQNIGDIAACGIGAWCLSALLLTAITPISPTTIPYAAQAPILPFLICLFLLWTITALLSFRLPVAPPFLLISMLLYGGDVLYRKADAYIYLMTSAVLALAVVYVVNRKYPEFKKISEMSRSVMLGLISAIGAVILAYLLIMTLCRLFSYSSPCFDFGIFTQMFHNMRESGLPLTTCERDKLLSHFAVHVSPIYYIYLPFYALFPAPATLLVMQAIFLFSGVVPVVLLARKLSLSRPITVLISALYFAYPPMISGCFYDLHENKLLLPLLLWLFYFLETKRYPWVYVFSILVLLVKEDAPIYIAFVALYWLAVKPRKRHGIILLVLSVLYFFGVVWYLETYGDGAMFWRFDNLTGRDATPVDLIRTAVLNPSLILREMLHEEKLAFLFYMLLPLGVLPLITRHFGRMILLLPMVLINLMPDYFYQHNIGYQYTYGVAAMLFYLLLLNLGDICGKLRHGLLLFALCATVLLGAMRLPGQVFYLQRAVNHAEDNARITECLALIPEDASVRASTMFVPHLSRREIFEIQSRNDTEYAVLDLRPYVNAHVDGIDVDYFEAMGYRLVHYEEDLIALFQRGEK